jgi:hypothetical protein
MLGRSRRGWNQARNGKAEEAFATERYDTIGVAGVWQTLPLNPGSKFECKLHRWKEKRGELLVRPEREVTS